MNKWIGIWKEDQALLEDRKIYEFLRKDKTTFLLVGRLDQIAHIGAIGDEAVAYREWHEQ